MVPIHDTDVAEERWTKSEWETYELWEKVELRARRKRRIWIVATFFLFLILSAVPIVMNQYPRWIARSLARQLGQQINQMKRDASIAKSPYRIRIYEGESLQFTIEKVADCEAGQGEVIQTRLLDYPSIVGKDGTGRTGGKGSFRWVSSEMAAELGVPGLVNQFCYDPFKGSDATLKGKSVAGVGVISVKDLAEKRVDRIALLLLTGPSAEISFE